MDKEQKQQEQEYLNLLAELAQSHLWPALLWWLNRGYNNADSVLHSVNCKIREYYIGKCDVYKEILDLRSYVNDELEKIKNE